VEIKRLFGDENHPPHTLNRQIPILNQKFTSRFSFSFVGVFFVNKIYKIFMSAGARKYNGGGKSK
jgi:hypothetical protein